ncbi:hypothetical protein B9Z19DRAFT_1127964 [Tuber borchii]|uniref:Uncharacterized protein n=1 Tax=Tuber borchii TaxID=42251 RepID=A0A2T6ZQF5_TUBBO|nr:hypothetical protein B9Z19DRAFT_1127964 [Tuber borchii]
MSPRRVSEEAGLDEPLDNTTLAAFGFRQLRTEYVLLKRLLIESEGRIKELMQANYEMGRRGERMKSKVGVLEGEKEAIKQNSKEDLETRTRRPGGRYNEKANEDFEALSLQQPSLEEKLRFANDQHQTSASTITHLQQALSTTELATRKLTKEKESPKNDLDKAAREAEASRIRFAQLLYDAKKMFEKNEEVQKLAAEVKEMGLKWKAGGEEARQ